MTKAKAGKMTVADAAKIWRELHARQRELKTAAEVLKEHFRRTGRDVPQPHRVLEDHLHGPRHRAGPPGARRQGPRLRSGAHPRDALGGGRGDPIAIGLGGPSRPVLPTSTAR